MERVSGTSVAAKASAMIVTTGDAFEVHRRRIVRHTNGTVWAGNWQYWARYKYRDHAVKEVLRLRASEG